ncbi:Probable metallocarboxypeptidase A Short=MCPA; AltName: Full=Carboxypeptidase M14A; Flags: Precursor [Serendipita indica DSM 11827]|uniref:Probable carboxypeptidase n=1 Tax=Serendipita indica (strain DSM 11827) TaxID=1109443 RepID=G4T4T3_SERID|nr:Probable metallocarboxypeptidase A Short=MCPA; AltName: Full=Carboxypeptidase M14A; Flags: Precursor [Serendipita indica DSM 11827]CCA66426.1 probable carboxypeptidase [Serendipita indica DSM 11827]
MRLLALLSTLLVLFALGHALPQPRDNPASQFMGVKVVRIPTGPSVDILARLQSLIAKHDLDLWTTTPTINSHVDVEVPPGDYDSFMKAVQELQGQAGILEPVTIMHEDLGKSILEESSTSEDYAARMMKAASLATPAWFNAYHPYADHLTFLNDLAAAYPSNAKVVTAGTSVQGRAITGINIFGSSGSGVKPAIVWHANVHAREWITSMTVEYMAYQLLTNYANSTEIKSYVDKYDFYIFPVVNPDGFVYSQTTNRMWRKNRQSPPSGSSCYGRDINRNWDIHWSDPGGASTNPCDETYRGLAPADAPETKWLAAFSNGKKNSTQGMKMYVDWHSYSQMFFTPYGFDCDAIPPDNTELLSLAKGFTTSLKAVYGTSYTYGGSCKTIYKTTGSSDDYAYVVTGVKYSFSAELRDTGRYGFVLPANQIYPTGIETWAGVRYLLANMK